MGFRGEGSVTINEETDDGASFQQEEALNRIREPLYGLHAPMSMAPELPYDFATRVDEHKLIRADISSCRDLLRNGAGYGALSWYLATIWEFAWSRVCCKHDLEDDLTVGEFAQIYHERPFVIEDLHRQISEGCAVLEKLSWTPLSEIEDAAEDFVSGIRAGGIDELPLSPKMRLTGRYLQYLWNNMASEDPEFVASSKSATMSNRDRAPLTPFRMSGILTELYVGTFLEMHFGGKVFWYPRLDAPWDVDLTAEMPGTGHKVAFSIKMGKNNKPRREPIHGQSGLIAERANLTLGMGREIVQNDHAQDIAWSVIMADLFLYLKNASLFDLPRRPSVTLEIWRKIDRTVRRFMNKQKSG